MRFVLFGGLALASTLWIFSSCGGVECGDGTFEVDGRCKPVDNSIQIVRCGKGFTVIAGTCVPEKDWMEQYCGENTTYDPQQGLCIGTGGTVVETCTDPKFKCPPPSGGSVCISGRVFEAGSWIEKESEGDPIKLVTDKVKVDVYDPLAFASDPKNTEPLASATAIDDDGCFIIPSVAIPFAGFFSITPDDSGSADDFVQVGLGLVATAGNNLSNIALPALHKTTITAWEGELGKKVEDLGAMVIQYRTPGGPVSGLVPLKDQAEPPWPSGELLYFDAAPASSPYFSKSATSTTDSGAVLIIGASIATYGGKKTDCTVESRLGGSAPGTVLFVTFSGNGKGC